MENDLAKDLRLPNGVAMPRVGLGTWPMDDGEAAVAGANAIGLGYRLIHWPNPDQDRYVEAFDGLTRLLDAGLVRAIGTSNFKPAHLDRLIAAGFVPHVNQIQLDPTHRRDDIIAIHEARGIVTGSWSPIARGDQLLSDPVVVGIAARVGRTPAQVVLRWHVQSGYVPVPKSSHPVRQASNLAIFNFALADEDMVRLNGMDRPDPDMFDADIFGH